MRFVAPAPGYADSSARSARLTPWAIFSGLGRWACSRGAAKGMGAAVNGRPLQVSQIDKLPDSMVAMDWARNEELRQSAMDLLPKFVHRISFPRVFGSAALAMAWVAAGRVDLYLNYHLQTWDVAAASIILAEAGGRLTDLHGRPWTFAGHSGDCIASNNRVHQEFMALIHWQT